MFVAILKSTRGLQKVKLTTFYITYVGLVINILFTILGYSESLMSKVIAYLKDT